MDLSSQQWLGQKSDWVLSLEVGEHIPIAFEDVFFDNLLRHASIGVVLSWAVEGQGGHYHVNEHSNAYVIKKMKGLGLLYDARVSLKLRSVATLWWMKNTVMVFRWLP